MSTDLSFATAVLGLFLSFPLFALARRQPANAWLGLFVLAMAWLCLAEYMMSTAWLSQRPHWLAVFHGAIALLGPAYYSYVRGMTGLAYSRQQLLHFAPFFLLLGLLFGGLAWVLLAESPILAWRFLSRVLVFSFFSFQFLSFCYACAVLYRLRAYRKQLSAQFSATAGRDLRWLQWSSLTLGLLLLLWIPAGALGGGWALVLGLGRLAMLLTLGWYGLHQQRVFLPAVEAEPAPGPVTAQPSLAADEPAPAPVAEASEAELKYARSGMTEAAQGLIAARLARRMGEHRDFLEPDLRLGELAERIGSTPHWLSQYLNDALGMSFFDYVNGLRAQEVQHLMRTPEHAGSTLLDLAHAAGFASKSTFNSAFKKTTGLAPSAWRKLRAEASEPIG